MPTLAGRLSLLLLASATTTLLSSASVSSSSFSKARWVGRVRGGDGAAAESTETSPPPNQITPGLDKKDFTLLKEADLYRVLTVDLPTSNSASALLSLSVFEISN